MGLEPLLTVVLNDRARVLLLPANIANSLTMPMSAIPRLPAPTLEQLQHEYVSGAPTQFYTNVPKALPWSFDDVTADFGDDIYSRMLLDSQVSASITVLKASIVETGMELQPAITDKHDPDYELAVGIHKEAERMQGQYVTPLADVLWNMADAIPFGNKIAEIKWGKSPSLSGKSQLRVTDIKVKPRRSTAYVVDAYLNIIGILGAMPGKGLPVLLGYIADPQAVANLLPRERFFAYTWRPIDSDPRGTSTLRPCFAPWNRKQQIYGDYLKFLAQFATPSTIGYTPPSTTYAPNTDDLGNPSTSVPVKLTPQQKMLATLMGLKNSSALVFPNGAIVQLIQSQGNGEAFYKAFAECDQQITKAILTQTLTTEEGEHQSRAASQVHMDVQGIIVRQGKLGLQTAYRRDVLTPWVRYNYGDRAADLLTPICDLGAGDEQDKAAIWASTASLNSAGYIRNEEQRAEIDSQIGIAVRDLSIPADDQGQAADVGLPGVPVTAADPVLAQQAQNDTRAAGSEQRQLVGAAA
jgi:hypothetical protein